MLTTQFIPIVVIIGGLVTPEPAIFPREQWNSLRLVTGGSHLRPMRRDEKTESPVTHHEPGRGFWRPKRR
jgi:hypothetical protein